VSHRMGERAGEEGPELWKKGPGFSTNYADRSAGKCSSCKATPAAQWGECATDADFYAVTQLLTIPEFLHSVRMQEWIKRNSLHQEKDPCN
jgi:hypothetical protein